MSGFKDYRKIPPIKKLGLIIVCNDSGNERCKWLIKQNNILEDKYPRALLCNMIGFGKDTSMAMLNSPSIYAYEDYKKEINTVFTDANIGKPIKKSGILSSDRFRKLNLQEYITLSNILKKYKMRYNKETKELIKTYDKH